MAVLVAVQGLRGHVDRRAHIVLLSVFKVLLLDRETKVADLQLRVVEEDVGGFQVSVYDAQRVQTLIAFYDLFYYLGCLVLTEFLLSLDQFTEVAALAEIGNYVCFVLVAAYLVDIQQVGPVLDQGQDLYLAG